MSATRRRAALEEVQGQTPALYAQQMFLANQDAAILAERQYVNQQLRRNCFADSLVSGAGNDTFYGSPTGTWLGGGTGTIGFYNYFYNYAAADTIAGGLGKDNVLMFQGDGAISLQHVVDNGPGCRERDDLRREQRAASLDRGQRRQRLRTSRPSA